MSRKQKLEEGFKRMFGHFGPRHWWPGDTSFEVMVGAILTQNTSWKNVERAITNLKNEKLLHPKKLLALSPESLASLIRPAGYFRVKTKRLRNFLKFYMDEFGGSETKMRAESLEELRPRLLAVSGIGPETADSILLYALDKPVFVIDAYTKRLLNRHSLCSEDATYGELQELFMDSLPSDAKRFNEYHALIVETGKNYCRKNPKCSECPLEGW